MPPSHVLVSVSSLTSTSNKTKQSVKRGKQCTNSDDNQTSSPSTESAVATTGREVKTKVRTKLIALWLAPPDHIKVFEGCKGKISYQCKICLHKFRSSDHVKYHEFCKSNSNQSASAPKKKMPFSCHECGNGFIAKHHYVYHCRVHAGIRPYKCETCGKDFYQLSGLKRHEETHLKLPFLCEFCGKNYSLSQTLRAHIRKYHTDAEHSCYFCDDACISMKDVKKFFQADFRPFQCEQCGQRFKRTDTLKVHLRTHSLTPHVCSICSAVYKRYKNLTRHNRKIHSDSSFQSEASGINSTQQDNLSPHTKSSCKNQQEKIVTTVQQSKDLATLPQFLTEITLDTESLNLPEHLISESELTELVLTLDDF